VSDCQKYTAFSAIFPTGYNISSAVKGLMYILKYIANIVFFVNENGKIPSVSSPESIGSAKSPLVGLYRKMYNNHFFNFYICDVSENEKEVKENQKELFLHFERHHEFYRILFFLPKINNITIKNL